MEKLMKIKIVQQPEKVKDECVVVIDVLRAFTTEAYAFASGIDTVFPVGTIEEAFSIKRTDSQLLLCGEIDGEPVAVFDYGNSPSHFVDTELTGRCLVHRTTAGTQGVVRSLDSDHLFVSSFVVAEATIAAVANVKPKSITLLVTGKNNGDEDFALAE